MFFFQLPQSSRPSPRSPTLLRPASCTIGTHIPFSSSHHGAHHHVHSSLSFSKHTSYGHVYTHTRSASDVPPPLPARNRSLMTQTSVPNVSTSFSPFSSSCYSLHSHTNPPSLLQLTTASSTSSTTPLNLSNTCVNSFPGGGGTALPPPLPPRPPHLERPGVDVSHAQSLENIPKVSNLVHVSVTPFPSLSFNNGRLMCQVKIKEILDQILIQKKWINIAVWMKGLQWSIWEKYVCCFYRS